jgi:hypothetical protein
LALPYKLKAAIDSLSANLIGGEGRGEVALRFMEKLEEHNPNGAPASQPAFNAREPQV